MSSRPSSPQSHPIMLDDLIRNVQHLAAHLPPDGWDPDSPPPTVERHASGALGLYPIKEAKRLTDPGSRGKVGATERWDEETGLLSPINENPEPNAPADATDRPRQNLRRRCGFFKRTVFLLRRHRAVFAIPKAQPKTIFERLKACIKRPWPSRKDETKGRKTHGIRPISAGRSFEKVRSFRKVALAANEENSK